MQLAVAFAIIFSPVVVATATPEVNLQLNCPLAKVYQGCKADTAGLCKCGQIVACSNPFKYSSLMQCIVNNKPTDPCKPNPCKHRGFCLQIGASGYRCECHGTGYYGKHCHLECPKPKHLWRVFRKMLKANMNTAKLLQCLVF